MAHHLSAKKRIRQSEQRKLHNRYYARSARNAVKNLLAFDKPIVLVLNKADRYNDDERALLLQSLLQRIDQLGGEIRRDHVVAVSAGGASPISFDELCEVTQLSFDIIDQIN